MARKVLTLYVLAIQGSDWAVRTGCIKVEDLEGWMMEFPPLCLIAACEEVPHLAVWQAGIERWVSFSQADPAIRDSCCWSLWDLIHPPKSDAEGALFIERFATPGFYDDWTEENHPDPSARLNERGKVQAEMFTKERRKMGATTPHGIRKQIRQLEQYRPSPRYGESEGARRDRLAVLSQLRQELRAHRDSKGRMSA